MTRAVFFDVDFTLIYPGPTFRGEGYREFGERHGLLLDPARFDAAVLAASSILDEAQGDIYDAAIFHGYTARIIRDMGGEGPGIEPCAVEIYEEWAANHHFSMYDDVPAVLRAIAGAGIRIGLISNSHRCLASFERHFALDGLIAAAVSSSAHGYLKPHPSIFQAAMRLAGVTAAGSLMVGDSVGQDIAGAKGVGMSAVLVRRGVADQPFPGPPGWTADVPVIRTLDALLPILDL